MGETEFWNSKIFQIRLTLVVLVSLISNLKPAPILNSVSWKNSPLHCWTLLQGLWIEKRSLFTFHLFSSCDPINLVKMTHVIYGKRTIWNKWHSTWFASPSGTKYKEPIQPLDFSSILSKNLNSEYSKLLGFFMLLRLIPGPSELKRMWGVEWSANFFGK